MAAAPLAPLVMPQLIGVDLGGTAIKLGRFSREGERLAALQVPTPQPAMPGAVSVAIAEAVQQLDPERLADRVGIGLPGPMDAAGRVARVCINLPGWQNVPCWGRPGAGLPGAAGMWCCSPLAPALGVGCC